MSSADVPTAVYLDRFARVRSAMADQGVDALLLSVGHDLPYLTGYLAMPLERLTMLVVPREGDATLLIPRLEAPRVAEQPGVFELLPWNETDDPTALAAALLARDGATAYASWLAARAAAGGGDLATAKQHVDAMKRADPAVPAAELRIVLEDWRRGNPEQVDAALFDRTLRAWVNGQ